MVSNVRVATVAQAIWAFRIRMTCILLATVMPMGVACGHGHSRAARELCATDGESVPSSCAEQLVPGFRPVTVSGYDLRSVRADGSLSPVQVTLSYVATGQPATDVVINTQASSEGELDTRLITYPRVDVVRGVKVGLSDDGAYSATANTVVNGVFYQVQVLRPPDLPPADLEEIRRRFLDAIVPSPNSP